MNMIGGTQGLTCSDVQYMTMADISPLTFSITLSEPNDPEAISYTRGGFSLLWCLHNSLSGKMGCLNDAEVSFFVHALLEHSNRASFPTPRPRKVHRFHLAVLLLIYATVLLLIYATRSSLRSTSTQMQPGRMTRRSCLRLSCAGPRHLMTLEGTVTNWCRLQSPAKWD